MRHELCRFVLEKDDQSIYLFVSVEAYVKSLGQPGLLDLLVQAPSEDVGLEDVEDLRPSKKKIIYTEVSLFASAFF